MNKSIAITLLLCICTTLVACTSPTELDSNPNDLPVDISAEDPSQVAMTTACLRATPPPNMAGDASIAIMILDEVTGLPFNAHTLPLQEQADGSWQIEIDVPHRTLLRYRYIRTDSNAEEVTATRTPVEYRIAFIPGPTCIDDVISGWSDEPDQRSTGKIIGRILDANTGLPLVDMLVFAGGEMVFSDGLGSFRFDHLIPGLHNITVLSPAGAYETAQQGAVVAAGKITPAEMYLAPAPSMQVTFEVTVPENTPTDLPLRIAGNIFQLGYAYQDLGGGNSTLAALMPEMIKVDATHYIFITQLYRGVDLRYKYTFGDGLWNTERDQNGFFRIRQLIVPAHDLIINDTVDSWLGENQKPVTFHVSVPSASIPGENPGIQFNPFTWFAPLPMQQQADGSWSFTLFNPLDFVSSVEYRYCRNLYCSAKSQHGDMEFLSQPRTFDPYATHTNHTDVVQSWTWWHDIPPVIDHATQILPRSDFETGIELLPCPASFSAGIVAAELANLSSQPALHLTFSPAWKMGQASPAPQMSFSPANGPFYSDLHDQIEAVSATGTSVNLHPRLEYNIDQDQWWAAGIRDWNWWNTWFERYRSFLLTYARLSEETGVEKLIIGGPEILPALPGGTLADGSSSNLPADVEARWRAIIADIRSIYNGTLALELVFTDQLTAVPAFVDAVDEVHINWQVPIAISGNETIETLQANADRYMNEQLLSQPALAGKAIILRVAYASFTGSATSCPQNENGECLSPKTVANGMDHAQFPPVDFEAQTRALLAVLQAAAQHSEIQGFYIGDYNLIFPAQDKSLSIHGKPAGSLFPEWFAAIHGH